MAYKLTTDPLGPTRQLGRRGALKQATFLQLKKSPELLTVESAFEVLLAKLADLSNAVTLIDYQPFTIDVANERVLLTHSQLQAHRQKLREAGMRGVFYTPDLRFRWRAAKGHADEVLEAKDAAWVPTLGDAYADKLLRTRTLLALRGIQFSLYEAGVTEMYQWSLVSTVNKLHALMLRRQDAMNTFSPDYLQYLEYRDAFLDVVRANPAVSLGQLSARFNVTLWATWHLLIDELVSVDLWSAPLGPNTSVVDACNAPDEPGLFRRAMLAMRNTSWEVSCGD
ncbi:hypothetical protein [Pusillimonas sp. NJUB218]|uniref:hypothetical protein n=1 Tax=Pusillimonas sp. NJUB218 TaxID=2023230 RepID=UPI000F4D1A85|nr:hypothetical protein [Pusillimonas sp. NJUB218]ROT43933.1 hypothetical protein CHR62_15005 [Pusillimonas sp. NJUB218]